MNIIVLGPQGSGKGTQARLLADKYGLFYVESGEFLREIAKVDSEVDKIINKEGKLLPDEKTFSLIKGYLEEKAPSAENLLFDGYPRSLKQYDLLKGWLSEKGEKIDHAIFLTISEEESIRRISARRMDRVTGKVYNLITNPPGPEVPQENLVQRPDDTPKLIKERLEQYKETTRPLIEIFENEGILRKVEGERPIEIIFADLQKIVSGAHGG